VTAIVCPYIQQYSKVGCLFSRPLCLDKTHSRYQWTALELFLHIATSGQQQNVGEGSYLKIQTLTHNQTTEKDFRRSAKLCPMSAGVKRNPNHRRDRGINRKRDANKYVLIFISVDNASRLHHLNREIQKLLLFSKLILRRFASIDLCNYYKLIYLLRYLHQVRKTNTSMCP
jgi:hypothetical protein